MGNIENDLLRLEHSSSIYNNIFVVNWIMGNSCNFSCSYCAENLHDCSEKWPSFENAKRFIDKICFHYNNRGKTIYFDLTGGEITLNKDLIKIVEYLQQKECWVGLITNGTQSIDYWEKLKSRIDHICITFHPQSTKKEHLLAVVELLHSEVTVHVNIMMEPNSFELCKDVGRDLCARMKNISMSYQPLVKELGYDNNIYNYSSEQIDEIVKLEKQINIEWTRRIKTYRGKMKEFYMDGSEKEISTPELLATGKSNWIDWDCWAGLEQLVINANGDIYRAWCKQDFIGNINDENISFPVETTVCKSGNCFCQLDLASTKRRRNCFEKNSFIENEEVRKITLSIKDMNWVEASDSSAGGNSTAQIQNLSKLGFRGQLVVRASQLNYFFAIFSFTWNFDIDQTVKGLSLKMYVDRGKILTVHFPLQTNVDYDFFQTQIFGDGEKEYKINFDDICQQGFGTTIKWNVRQLKEVRFVNEYLKNDINLEVKEILALY